MRHVRVWINTFRCINFIFKLLFSLRHCGNITLPMPLKRQLIMHQLNAEITTAVEQDAQLSQRDRAAGCVTVFAKSRRLELGDNILLTL